MKTKVKKGLFIVPVLYIVIISAFIYLQFSESSSFSSRIAHLTLTGDISKAPWGEGDEIRDLKILGTGIFFNFDKETPLRIHTRDGLVHKLETRKYKTIPGGMVIELENDFTLTLTQDEENTETVRMKVEAPDYDSIKSLEFPFFLMQDFVLETAGGLPVFTIHNAATQEVTVMGLPMGSQVDPENHKIIMIPEKKGFGDLVIEKGSNEASDPYAYWFSKQGDLLSEREYNSFLEGYIEKSLEGWKSSRFNRNTLTWADGEGKSLFNEDAAVALLTELRGDRDYTTSYNRVLNSSSRETGNYNLPLATYVGDIVNSTNNMLDDLKIERERAMALIDQESPEVFQNRNLYFLMTAGEKNGPPSELLEIARNTDISEITFSTALGMLNFYHDCVEEEGEAWPELENFTTIPEQIILPSIQAKKNGFFLVSQDGYASLEQSIEAGRLLICCSEHKGKEILKTLGQEIIHSSLLLSDGQGFIPETLFFDGTEVVSTGMISPESIYAGFSQKDNLPKAVSLYDEFGPGRWLFTNADKVEVSSNQTEEIFHFEAPKGVTHSILIQGVEPGFSLQLLGLKWNPDAIFQHYYAGWYYDSKVKSLYIKLRQSEAVEEIRISY